MNILGNIVLLTGGSAGIGLATAEYLMKQGYTVYAASRRGSENIEDPFSGGRIIGLCADVTIPESLETAVNRIVEEQGELSAVICNAGNGIAGAVEDTSLEEARYQMETTLAQAEEVQARTGTALRQSVLAPGRAGPSHQHSPWAFAHAPGSHPPGAST